MESQGGILDALFENQRAAGEGLSAAALQEQLHKVEVRREEVLLTLYANIVERWPATDADGEEPASDGGAAAAAGPPLELDAAFCSTLATLQDQGLAGDDDALAQILALAAQQAAVCAQLQQTLAAADGIRLSAEFQQRLADFDALAGQGSYTEAAWTALELQRACQALPPAEQAQQVAARVEPFTQHLQQLVYSLVAVDPASRMPRLQLGADVAADVPTAPAEASLAAGRSAPPDGAQPPPQVDGQQAAEGGAELEGELSGGTEEAAAGTAGGWEGDAFVPGSTPVPSSGAVSRSESLSTTVAPLSKAQSIAGDGGGSGPTSTAVAAAPAAPAGEAATGPAAGRGGAGGGVGSGEARSAALCEVWSALGVLGLLDAALGTLARYVMEQSVRPILASPQDPAALVTESPALSVASTNLSTATSAALGGEQGRNTVERLLYKALRALTEQVLCGNAEYAGQLGAVLWPQLASAYIATQLKPLTPQSDTEVEAFSRRSSLGAKLEAKAVKLGLLPGGGQEGPISRYTRLAVGRLLAARRNRLVAAARDLLSSSGARETSRATAPSAAGNAPPQRLAFEARGAQRQQQQGGANGGLQGDAAVLATAEYSVSQAAEQVVALMRDALGEACSSGNAAVAQCMCAVVVDVADLVAAPPGGGSPGELQLPYLAALRHNDCHYIYQALLALPQHFSPRLQRLVHRGVSFAAPAARVRKAGDDCLEAMLLKQEEELGGLADGLEGFASLDGPGAIRCRKVVMQLLHAFRRLGSVLRGVLPPAVYVDVAARLVQGVCTRLIGEIMAMHDISVDESEQIPRILEDLVSGALDALLPPLTADTSSGKPPRGRDAQAQPGKLGAQRVQRAEQQPQHAQQQQAQALAEAMRRSLEEKTPSVMKLRELLELLDIRLLEIRRRWADGRLQALGFSAGEVAHVVAALFDHSDLRRDFLTQLEAEGGHGI